MFLSLCAMKSCSESLLVLKVICVASFPVFPQAQQIRVRPEVTGYLGLDVTLPCHFIQGPERDNITQVQWDLLTPPRNRTVLIVSSSQHGVNLHDSPLKERVKITEQSLIITDVKMTDAGSYRCTLSAFPSGSFEGNANLIVKEKMPLPSVVIAAIVIAVMLLVGILASVAYLIFIRNGSIIRSHVYIDISVPTTDASRQSVLEDEDVLYSDIKLKPSKDAAPSSSHKNPETTLGNDVMYAEVVF